MAAPADDVIVLVVGFEARPGTTDALRAALDDIARASTAEAGCLEYTLHEDRDDPHRFVLYERWADQAALDEHDQTAHVHDFVARFPELLAGPVGKRRLRRT
jgi:quinol monooxygenase YgiN